MGRRAKDRWGVHTIAWYAIGGKDAQGASKGIRPFECLGGTKKEKDWWRRCSHPVAKPETQESMAREETTTREPLRLHAFERPMI